MSDPQGPELRPAYRTLNEPTRLLGLSLAGWGAVLIAAGTGYGWLLISPLPWRANVSLAAIALGLPAALIVLREQSTINPVRLLFAVVWWRARPPLVVAPSNDRPVGRGALRLDATPPVELATTDDRAAGLPWVDHIDGQAS